MFNRNLYFLLFFVFVLASCGDSNPKPSDAEVTNENKDSAQTDENANNEWKTIGNDLYTIKYPSEWTRNMEVTANVHFALISPSEGDDDIYGENINLVVKELFDPALNTNEDFGLSLDRIAGDFEKQINTILPDGEVLRNERKEMNDLEFHEIQYNGSDGTNDLTIVHRFWLDKGRAYTLTYSGLKSGGYALNEDAATKIMDSFVIN